MHGCLEMEDNEHFITKIWLEEHEQSPIIHHKTYCQHEIKLSKKQITNIKAYCKNNKLGWGLFINSAWCLLLHRLSTSDAITYGMSYITKLNVKSLETRLPIQSIASIIDQHTSVEQLENQIKKQLSKKNKSNNELRYLLLLKGKNFKSKKTFPINNGQFPLILVTSQNTHPTVTFLYSTLFSKKNIKSIADHFVLLVNKIINDKTQKIVFFDLLTKNENKLLFHQWNTFHSSLSYPKLNAGCSHELFEYQCKNFPSRIAINHQDQNITYSELKLAIMDISTLLIQKGVTPHDRVCVLMERTPTLIAVMFAIFKVGAIYVPINPKYPDERIKYIINDAEPKCIIVNTIIKLSISNQVKSLILDQDLKNLTFEKSENQKQIFPCVSPTQIAYIIYTSGTTGQPKGVMIKHESLVNLTAWYIFNFNITENDRASQFASQAFDTSLCEIVPFLSTGGSVHIVDDAIKLTPNLFFAWLKNQKITICDLPTAYAQLLFTLAWPNDTALKMIKIGGESLMRYPNQKFTFDIWNIYGPTEATIETTYEKIYTANTSQTNHTIPPIGKPIFNSEIYIVDKYLQPVPIGVAGELLIGGINTAAGYFHRDDLTYQKFTPHPFDKNNKFHVYKTGDLVRFSEEGNLIFIGRVDKQIKIRGYRIELSEIENTISQFSDVNKVVVLVKENFHGEKSLVAYVVPDLNKERYPYQERCLLSLNNQNYIEALTEDISKEGVALSGIAEVIPRGHLVQLHLKLPGLTEPTLLAGHLVWQDGLRAGIAFDLSEEEKAHVAKSIDYYLSIQNTMELILSASAKRSLRKALQKKLPEFMIPSAFVTLMDFPLTFSGKIDFKALPPLQGFEQTLQKKYIPPKSPTEKKLTEIWSNLLNRNNISMSDHFFELGGSSLTVSLLSVAVLNQFKISIPVKILFDLSYIPILAEYIDTKGKKYVTHTLIQDEIEQDSKLHENIVPTKKNSTADFPEHILLTGAGGFLGIYLLRELLKQTNAKIYCLIRRGEFETAAKRLISTIQKFNLNEEISLANRRITVIASDIGESHFGLAKDQYNSLASKVDMIYHCGAQVNMMAAYSKLRSSNVQGTIEIIKFATTHIDKPIHYISTLSAACCRDKNNYLVEDFPDKHYESLFGGYAISKWVSERLLTEIKNRGLPVSIYRSGYITGQSNNGITNLNDALFMFIKGCLQLKYAPDINEKITILPVDFVSQAITKISLVHPNRSCVYHLDHPKGIMWKDLIAWLNHYGYSIKIIPLPEWKDKLITVPQDNALFPLLPYFLAKEDNDDSTLLHMQHAKSALENLGMNYPKIDDQLLKTYFNYLCAVNYLPLPNEATHL